VRRLYMLDGLRGAAALIVALHHIVHPLPLLPSLAVDLFFLLSGFVMARTYEERMRAGLSTTRFLAIRYRRLFLPLFIGSTLGLAAVLFNGYPPTLELWSAYALALAFLPVFWVSNAFPFDVPAWSLFLELAANVLHGSLFARVSVRGLLAALATAVAAAAILFAKGWSHWDYGLAPIASMLPRELAFYLLGIIVFRRHGDAPFDVELGHSVRTGCAWVGALSYPLYATHLPILRLSMLAGLPPAVAFAAALTFAALLAVTFERRRLLRPPNTRFWALSDPAELLIARFLTISRLPSTSGAYS
jgi:peptidoglycan/LPS O-acetylase OafA/YrhL